MTLHRTPLYQSRDARGVLTLTLDVPNTRNALSPDLMDALHDAARDLASDEATRVVVLRGAGAMFCAGGDLNWMRAQRKASPEERRTEARRLAFMLQALDRIPQVLIGQVHGGAFGGGVGLMSVCDLCVGTKDARFGLTETRLGLIPATIGPYVGARIGPASARRTMLSGRRFGADEALALGLLFRVVPEAELGAAVAEEVAEHLKAAPGAIASAKAMIRALAPPVTDEAIEATIDRLVERWDSAEALEGIDAFFAKRSPKWIET